MKVLRQLICSAALALAATAAPARADLLSNLIAGGSLVSGDKLFDNFSYSFTGDMPDASLINVIAIVDGSGNFGIEFQGGFVDNPGGGTSDALIKYRVTVLTPGLAITDAHLSGNPAVVGGTGSMTVTETFLPESPLSMTIFDIGGGGSQPSDSVVFPGGFLVLDVQKDILGNAGTGTATLSFVDQTFSQSGVPEPATLALLGIGGVGIGAFAWSRRRRS